MFLGGIEKDGAMKSVVPETMIVLSVVLLLLLGQFFLKLCFMVLSTVTNFLMFVGCISSVVVPLTSFTTTFSFSLNVPNFLIF